MILDIRDLQPGDVLNSIADPRTPIHGPMAAATDSPIVHTAMFEQGTTAISALLDGVQRRPLDQWDRFMLVTRHPSPVMAQRALAECIRMIGAPYDLLGIAIDAIETIASIDLPDTQGAPTICSRLIVRAFERAGAIILPGYPEGDATPRALVEDSTLEFVGYLRIR